MAFVPITREDLNTKTKELDRHEPGMVKGELLDLLVIMANAIAEVQDEVVTLTGTISGDYDPQTTMTE